MAFVKCFAEQKNVPLMSEVAFLVLSSVSSLASAASAKPTVNALFGVSPLSVDTANAVSEPPTARIAAAAAANAGFVVFS